MPRKPVYPTETRQKAVEMRKNGVKWKEISNTLGIAIDTLRRWYLDATKDERLAAMRDKIANIQKSMFEKQEKKDNKNILVFVEKDGKMKQLDIDSMSITIKLKQ